MTTPYSPFVDITKPFLESKADSFVQKINEFVFNHLDYEPVMKKFTHADDQSVAYVLVFSSGADAMLFKLTVVW